MKRDSFDDVHVTSQGVPSTGRLLGVAATSSSVGFSSSWRQNTWTWSTTTPSNCSESGENVPSFLPFNLPTQCNPNTPPDSAFGSCSDQSRPASPFCRDGVVYIPGTRCFHDTLADSGVSSTEQSRPASPSTSPTRAGFPHRLGLKQRAASPVGRRTSGTEGLCATCTNCFTQITPLCRINPEGQLLCDTCGQFFRLHGVVRPPPLKTDLIKKRNRGEDVSALLGQRPTPILEKRGRFPMSILVVWTTSS